MSRQIALQLRRASLWTKVLVLGAVGALPALLPATVSAAPNVTNRSLTSTSAVPSATTQLEWTFNTPSNAANAKQIEIQFCDMPLGTCNTTNTPSVVASPTATLSGPWTTTTVTSAAYATQTLTIVKTNADDATSKTGLKITLAPTDVTNNATANRTYYTRMKIFSDTGTTLAWEGVFAQSTSQTLTVNARVQERLDFCVGSTTVNDATTSVGADCSAVTGNSVDIGNIDSTAVNVSPVTATNGGSDENGVAMIRTNAVNGASVAYRALGETGSGALKVPGATCVASPVSNTPTDQCFNTTSGQFTFTPGSEAFGMTIAAINPGSTSAYTCTFAGGNCNLVRDGAYDGTGAATYVPETDTTNSTTGGGYAWDADPTHVTTIASSTTSGIKVLDDEAMILKFAATSGITTPTGSYTVQADFIATATF